MTNLLPLIVIILSFFAGLILLATRQYGSALYWLSAATINFAATFGIKLWG